MLNKGAIISRILLELGNTRSYNDDMSKEYKVCEGIYETEIKNMIINTRFLFNSATVPMTYADREQNKKGEYKYNLPNGMKNLISLSGNGRMEGKFIFSPEKDLEITFCQDIPKNSIPDYMENYIVGKVGFKMAMGYSQYQSKAPVFSQQAQVEEIKINRVEVSTNRNYLSSMMKGRFNYY